jgi:hypothetical protein
VDAAKVKLHGDHPAEAAMRTRVLLTGLLFLLGIAPISFAQESTPFTNDSITQLVAWHFSEDQIVLAITRNPAHFDVSPQALAALAAKGVSPGVLAAMKTAMSASGSTVPTPPITASDEIIFTDGTITTGKVLYVQCSPGESAPRGPTVEFQSVDIKAKTAISGASIQRLILAGGQQTLSAATDPSSPVSAEIVDYLKDHPGPSSPLFAVVARPSVNLEKALIATCSATEHYWLGDIAATGAYAVGTQSQKQIGGMVLTSYTRNPYVYGWDYQVAVLDLEAKYTEALKVGSPPIKSQEIYYGSLNYSFHPSARWSPYAIARLYHNYSLGLDLGQIYGGGIEYKIHNLTLSGGLVGITDRLYSPGTHFSSAGARAYEAYSIILPFKKILWFESVEAFPAFQLAKAIQGRGIVGFAIPLTDRIQLMPKFVDDYLGDAPPKHRLNYTNTSISLDFKLGRTQ